MTNQLLRSRSGKSRTIFPSQRGAMNYVLRNDPMTLRRFGADNCRFQNSIPRRLIKFAIRPNAAPVLRPLLRE